MGDTDRQQLEELLRAELVAAMRARDRAVASGVRSALGRLDNAGAVPGPESSARGSASAGVAGATAGLGTTEAPRRELGVAEQAALVAAEQAELAAHGQRLRALCRWDAADAVQRASDVLGKVLKEASHA